MLQEQMSMTTMTISEKLLDELLSGIHPIFSVMDQIP